MKILITSGGTKVPIDRVRDITNMSHGTFGARIAHEALELKHEVLFLHANDSCTPLSQTFYFEHGFLKNFIKFIKLSVFGFTHRGRYWSIQFRNFDNYQLKLSQAVTEFQPDVIILAAAVSDYGVKNYIDKKIRTSDNQSIELYPLPKIIGTIKNLAPNAILVGFKLLIDNDEAALIAAAKASIESNNCDLVVANSLQSLIDNNHILYIVERNNIITAGMIRYISDTFRITEYRKNSYPEDQYYLARKIIRAIERKEVELDWCRSQSRSQSRSRSRSRNQIES